MRYYLISKHEMYSEMRYCTSLYYVDTTYNTIHAINVVVKLLNGVFTYTFKYKK